MPYGRPRPRPSEDRGDQLSSRGAPILVRVCKLEQRRQHDVRRKNPVEARAMDLIEARLWRVVGDVRRCAPSQGRTSGEICLTLAGQELYNHTGEELGVHLRHSLWMVEDVLAPCREPGIQWREQLMQPFVRCRNGVVIGRVSPPDSPA